MTNYLDKNHFLEVIENTPLISIDVVVKNSMGEVLLGFRKNEPARDFWFVPGGRICKDERIKDAFSRISLSELGVDLQISEAHFLGVFEHFYDRNFALEPGISTHYIVLAYAIKLDLPLESIPKGQHQVCRWWPIEELKVTEDVHLNTKAYFISDDVSSVS